jgi:DNA-binding transcriptional ArsR family regulator
MSDMNIYSVTSAIADPVRLSVMIYLMRGQATYAEIQQHLDISQSNLSNHISVLFKANLISKISKGRRNSYEIASSEVAQLIELLQNLQKTPSPHKPLIKNIALARTCYDHVAGKLGVSIFNALADSNAIIYADPGQPIFAEHVRMGINAEKMFNALGVDLRKISQTRRKYAYACLDWTEKKPHLAGAVGAALCHAIMEQKWVTRNEEKRVLRLTDLGRKSLKEIINLDFDAYSNRQ